MNFREYLTESVDKSGHVKTKNGVAVLNKKDAKKMKTAFDEFTYWIRFVAKEKKWMDKPNQKKKFTLDYIMVSRNVKFAKKRITQLKKELKDQGYDVEGILATNGTKAEIEKFKITEKIDKYF